MVQQSCLTIEDGIDRLSQKSVTKYQCALRNIPEERKSHLHCSGSLKLRQKYKIDTRHVKFMFNTFPYFWLFQLEMLTQEQEMSMWNVKRVTELRAL